MRIPSFRLGLARMVARDEPVCSQQDNQPLLHALQDNLQLLYCPRYNLQSFLAGWAMDSHEKIAQTDSAYVSPPKQVHWCSTAHDVLLEFAGLEID